MKECLPDSYDDYEEFIEEFDLGNKTIKGIKQQISSLYNFRGAEGFYLKYESKNTEKISEVFTVDFEEVEENFEAPEELEEKYERASELFSKYKPKEALPLLKELSDAGYGEANTLLYWIYVDGYYDNQQYYENPELANEYLVKGYMAGDSISTILYAMYYAKPADEKLISECYSEVEELAENGNIYAEYMLGILDINPIHGQVDSKSAVEHFIKSNRTGFYRAVGSVFLRCFRANEPFTNRDWYQEKFWADRVLKYMHPKRVYQVAYMYSNCEEYGCADTIEREKAYKMGWNLWMTLTQMGDIAAPNWLGLMYEFGRGVERNMVKAFSYYLLAAQRGDNIGQYNVGNCYYYGEGTETNEVKAIEWYVKSAKQGNNNAKEQLKKIGYYIY